MSEKLKNKQCTISRIKNSVSNFLMQTDKKSFLYSRNEQQRLLAERAFDVDIKRYDRVKNVKQNVIGLCSISFSSFTHRRTQIQPYTHFIFYFSVATISLTHQEIWYTCTLLEMKLLRNENIIFLTRTFSKNEQGIFVNALQMNLHFIIYFIVISI